LAVDFLTTEMNIPDAGILPYVNQMAVLAEVFNVSNTLTAQQVAATKRWFWRTSVTGYFGGWNTGMMTSDLKAARAFAAGTAAEIDYAYSPPPDSIWTTRTFRSNNAHSKLLGLILCHHHPVDLLTGVVIDVGHALSWENLKEYHHFFPKKFMAEEHPGDERVNALANIILLTSASNKAISDRAPSDYCADVEDAAGNNLDAWLESLLVPRAAFEAAKHDDVTTFLEMRAKAINSAVLAMT
jgi:hypothetical protein